MSKPAASASTSFQRIARHATFTIERVYDASPSRVFAAFADDGAKLKWFGGPDGWVKTAREFDFRVVGREYHSGGPAGGQQPVFDSHYYDIIPQQLNVSATDMNIAPNPT